MSKNQNLVKQKKNTYTQRDTNGGRKSVIDKLDFRSMEYTRRALNKLLASLSHKYDEIIEQKGVRTHLSITISTAYELE